MRWLMIVVACVITNTILVPARAPIPTTPFAALIERFQPESGWQDVAAGRAGAIEGLRPRDPRSADDDVHGLQRLSVVDASRASLVGQHGPVYRAGDMGTQSRVPSFVGQTMRQGERLPSGPPRYYLREGSIQEICASPRKGAWTCVPVITVIKLILGEPQDCGVQP